MVFFGTQISFQLPDWKNASCKVKQTDCDVLKPSLDKLQLAAMSRPAWKSCPSRFRYERNMTEQELYDITLVFIGIPAEDTTRITVHCNLMPKLLRIKNYQHT